MVLLTENYVSHYSIAAKILKLINYKLSREIQRNCLWQLHIDLHTKIRGGYF